MAQLYSDLIDGTSRRYYFGLTSAPGGITNAEPARLTVGGNFATIQEQNTVFRTPATAALSLIGLGSSAEPHLQPATAALAYQGRIAGLQTIRLITNALPPDYTDLPENPPTIIYIATIAPLPYVLTLNYQQPNVTQGGNIGFVSPGVGVLSVGGLAPNFPTFADVGLITVNGLQATLALELVVSPSTATLTVGELAATLSLPFQWVDDDPTPTPVWIDDPRA